MILKISTIAKPNKTSFKLKVAFFVTTLFTSISFAQSVSLKSAHNTYFVNEGNGGKGKTVNTNRTQIGAWERMIFNGNKDPECIKNGDKITISSANNKFWSARFNGSLHVDRDQPRAFETFTLINHSNSSS